VQLERLDEEYKKLKVDLSKSGKDKRVVFAMVSNLQQRIDLLNDVLTQIEEIKELKNYKNESTVI
jgi:archaellum component FlaC